MPDNIELEVLPTEKAFTGKQMLSSCTTISGRWISKKSFLPGRLNYPYRQCDANEVKKKKGDCLAMG